MAICSTRSKKVSLYRTFSKLVITHINDPYQPKAIQNCTVSYVGFPQKLDVDVLGCIRTTATTYIVLFTAQPHPAPKGLMTEKTQRAQN